MFFKVYHGLGGGFGGAQFDEVMEFDSQEEALAEAQRMAREDYESYEGCHGIMSFDDCARAMLQEAGYDEGEIDALDSCELLSWLREAGITEDDIGEMYEEEVESWIAYKVVPADSLTDNEED